MKGKVKIAPDLLIFIMTGIIYVFIEVVFTAVFGEMEHKFGVKYGSTMGFSSIYMSLIGGLLGVVLGRINEIDFISSRFNLFFQSLLGACAITLIELAAGIVLNLIFKFDIWDYSNYPLNFMGQIALFRSVLWFFICPLAFWFDDLVRSLLYGEGEPYSLLKLYLELFGIKSVNMDDLRTKFKVLK